MEMVSDQKKGEFLPGDLVIYGSHGRCEVKSVETKTVGGETLRFYKLEKKKPALSRNLSNRTEAAIWLPVQSAQSKGLRALMTAEKADEALSLLADPEIAFSSDQSWGELQPQLEKCVLNEGGLGMVKALGFLYLVIESRQVPPSQMQKFYENLKNLFIREIAEIKEIAIRQAEDEVDRLLKKKSAAFNN